MFGLLGLFRSSNRAASAPRPVLTAMPKLEPLEDRRLFAVTPGVTGLTLVKAGTGATVRSLTNGSSIDLGKLGTQVSVSAQTTGAVGSVKFTLDGKAIRVES